MNIKYRLQKITGIIISVGIISVILLSLIKATEDADDFYARRIQEIQDMESQFDPTVDSVIFERLIEKLEKEKDSILRTIIDEETLALRKEQEKLHKLADERRNRNYKDRKNAPITFTNDIDKNLIAKWEREAQQMQLPGLSNKQKSYIRKWYPTAKAEEARFGIPVSIKLAQAVIESNSGGSTLAVSANNHFGIKSTNCRYNRKGKKIWCRGMRRCDDSCDDYFVSYESAWYSFRGHSVFLKSNPRYDFLFNLRKGDYRGWAKGLKRAGYATSPTYANKLINFIESSGLHKYDAK